VLDARVPGNRCVAITFDDVFKGVLENAIPELENRGIPATLFVPTGFIGKRPGWAIRPGTKDQVETLPTGSELKQISQELFSFGSHTVSHPRLTDISLEQVERELEDSKQTLEELFGQEIGLLSFPHGAANEWVIQRTQSIGYKRVFTIDPEVVSFGEHDFVCGRVIAEPGESLIEFHLKIVGAYSWLPTAFKFKRWVTSGLHTLGVAVATKLGKSTKPRRAPQTP
jgi:peptidoglycan/xylan/chitin deacetylase (PgdA/CDA1 family)